MSLPRFAVQNPVAANLLMVAIIVAGGWCAVNLIREFFPTVDPEQVLIAVPYPGASPEEIEKSVARRIERELEGIDAVDEVQSRIFEGISQTVVELEEGADRLVVMGDVRDAVDRARPDLPDGAEDPVITLVRPYFPVISLVAYGDCSEARINAAARQIEDAVRGLGGISQVAVSGIRDREIHAEIQPAALERHRLSFEDVGRTLARRNFDLPGGRLKSSRGNVGVRTMGERDRARDFEEIVIRSNPDGSVVRLRDLGRVRETFEDRVERGLYRGQRAVLITVFKSPEQDALEVAQAVKDYAASAGGQLPGGVQLETLSDLSRFIAQRLELMGRTGRAGLILVAIALALFLDLRVAFWVALGLPISFLGTFLVMYVIGTSINLISLFGLIVVLGLLVDDAIVVGENIYRKTRAGMPARQAAIEGASQVSLPVVAAILTTMAAFGPLLFIDGRVGMLLKELPTVVIAALAVSLIEAFIILPAHLRHQRTKPLFQIPGVTPFLQKFGELRQRPMERWAPALLERVLRFIIPWRYVVLSICVGVLILAAGVLAGGLVPFVLLQTADAETVTINLEMTAGTPEERTTEVLSQLTKKAMALPEVARGFTVIGTSFSDRGREEAADPATVGQITLELVAAEERQEQGLRGSNDVVSLLRVFSAGIPGARKASVGARSGGPAGADIEIRFRGDDLETIGAALLEVRNELESYPAVEEIDDDFNLGKMEARLELRPSAKPLGLTTADLALQVRHALFGFEVQDLQAERDEVTVRVLLPEAARDDLGDLARLRLSTPFGARIPLGEAARITTTRGYANLFRVDGQLALTIRAEVDERRGNTNEITADLKGRMEEILKGHPAVIASFEGEKKETTESIGSLKIGFAAALLLIYSIVAILFRSYGQPLIVMAAIPFSLAGALAGHFLMGFPLTILSLFGIVALTGIVVNDSLLLVEFINRARREGMPTVEAAINGARNRCRAILLTSITTVLGVTPLMLERSFQAQFLIPMAVSLAFGLAFATVVTPLVLPLIYLVFDDLRGGLRWLFLGSRQPAPAAAGTAPE